ncbi:glycosyltransferase [Planctomicrobium sp. SH664]|uniref:glycosyltransferase n=1 Tax=Planctomicrobium sp. SH664 TaxID=3448125 RepID=UPI003F5B8B30
MPFAQKRVLFVSYSFPPVGGVGVQRVVKFVKYLPEFGWHSSVLTVSNPSVPLIDDTLSQEIPVGTILRRAKTYEPGYAVKNAVANGSGRKGHPLLRLAKSAARRIANTVLQPDAQILWHPHAYRTALKLLRDVPHDAIIATGPPFSSLLLGARISRATGLPLVLDYRDEWDISNAYWENKSHGRFGNWLQKRQQAQALRAADLLLATTPSSTQAVAEAAVQAGHPCRSHCLYNGFDPDDFPQSSAATGRTDQKFRLAFIGTLWNLNSIEPVVKALLQLSTAHPQLAGNLELLLAGRRTDDQEQVLRQLDATPVQVTRLPFVTHAEAIGLMRSADALLMLNSDLPKARHIINAKTFEYMAARRPMFVVAPRGDVWDIVRDLPGTMLSEPSDQPRIVELLELMLEQHRCGIRHDSAIWNIQRFERRSLTRELAELLDQLPERPTLIDGRNHRKLITP